MIFKIILILFLLGLVFVSLSAIRVIAFFRKGMQQFKQQTQQQNTQQRQQQHRYSNGQVVVDHRNAKEANKKIFKKNEGEYVDFQEEPIHDEKEQQP